MWKADEKQIALLRRTARVGASASIAIGSTLMALWLIGSLSPQTFSSSLFEMKFNTALGLTASGLGLLAMLRKATLWAAIAGCVVIVLGAGTIIEFLLGRNLGIDNLIITDFYAPTSPYPGRMSPGSSINFICAGLLLLLAAADGWRRSWTTAVMELLSYLIFALGAAGMLGYVENVAYAYSWGSQARMSPHTAVGFMLLGAGLTALVWLGQNQRIARAPLWMPAVLCLAVLMVDLATPRGVAVGVVYVPLVFCGLWFLRPHVTLVLAILASLLLCLGFFVKQPSEVAMWIVALNRILAVGAVWLAAAIVYFSQRSEYAFLRSESRLRSIIMHAPDGMITIDSRGTIASVNPACERIFGYSADEMLGHNIKMLMPDPYRSELNSYLERHLSTGETRILGTMGREVSGRRKDGSVFPMDLAISTFYIPDGQYFSGIVRDITARKEAETKLVRYTEALERSNAELDDFAHIASHDLKEPLRGLSHNAQFLLDDYGDRLDAQGQKRLRRTQHLTKRLERLVSDLLYFSRLGRQELAICPTDLNQIVHETASMMETYLHLTNATVTVNGTLPTVVCDSVRITEVFRNLITNAVKYNTQGSKRVEVGYLSEKLSPDGLERQVFYVKDNGIGIEEQFFEEIFRIFKRLNNEGDDTRGDGVGLTFVRKIITRHGGHIWLESTPGEGTTFYFTLAPSTVLQAAA